MILNGILFDVIAFLIVLSIIVLIHEFGHFIVAKKLGVKVEKFSLGFGPKLLGRQVGETEYLVSAIPLGGYVKLLGEDPSEELPPEDEKRSFARLSPYKRFLIIFAGPFFNFILAIVIFTIIFMAGRPVLKSVIGGVKKGYPAAAAGLKKGDVITSVNGVKVKSWGSLSDNIQKFGKNEIVFGIKENNKNFTVRLKPKYVTLKNIFGKKINVYLIGISPSKKAVYYKYSNFFSSMYSALEEIWFFIYVTVLGLFYLISGQVAAGSLLGGPILIAQFSGKAASLGISDFFHFIGVISVLVGFFNLLPIPALDGGHLFFSVIEMIKRKPVSARIQETATKIGFALLMLLLLFVSYNDVLRILKT